jgi:hypothetical protein
MIGQALLSATIGRPMAADSSSSTTGVISMSIGIPLADPAVHGGKIIRLDNRYAGATGACAVRECRTRSILSMK